MALKIAVGYPTKHPIHKPYLPIFNVCPLNLEHSG